MKCVLTSRGWRVIATPLILMVLALSPLIYLHSLNQEMPSTHTDLVPVWVGVRVSLAKRNPYSDETTRVIQTAYYGRPLTPADNVNKMGFAYPLYTIFVLSPLALMSWNTSRLLFLILVPVLMAIVTLLWLKTLTFELDRYSVTVLTVLSIIWWPVVWAFRLQQPTLIVAILLAAGCFLFKREHYVLSGLALSLSTIKPQLAGPLLLWLFIWAIIHKRWTFIVSFSIAVSMLFIGATLMFSEWFVQWCHALGDYSRYTHSRPTFQLMFGNIVGIALTSAVVLIVSFILFRLVRCSIDSRDFNTAISLALAATVCVTPTDIPMIYNQVLLLPAVLMIVYSKYADSSSNLFVHLSILLLIWSFVSTPIAANGPELTA